MPVKRLLLERDGYRRRFLRNSRIRSEIRKRLMTLYSDVMTWSKVNNEECHAAFLAMWAQYDVKQPLVSHNVERSVIHMSVLSTRGTAFVVWIVTELF